MRLGAALEALVSGLAMALVAVAAVMTLAKVVPGFPARFVRDVLMGGVLSVILRATYAAMRRLPPYAGAMALDRHHGLSDRVTNALAFSRLSPEHRTPMMEIAIEDACARGATLSPRAARPFGWPRDLGASVALLGGVLLLALLKPPAPKPVTTAETIKPVVLGADDLDLFREVGKKLAETDKSPEVLAALEQYNQLIEDLAQKRLDRTEAFRRMQDIETRLMQGRAMDAKTLDEQLRARADALKKSELSRPAAEALKAQDFAKAERALKDLAKRMRDKPDSFQKAALDSLREALKKASQGQKEHMLAVEERRKELQEKLLAQRQRDGGAGSEEEQRLLQKNERELERLDREKESQEQASRKLDRLDRDLAQAAEDIARQLGVSADDLDKGAEDINRMAQEKMSDEEREELRQRLEDLREQLRQEGQGGSERLARLRRFMRKARGEGQGKGSGNSGKKQPCPPDDPNCKPEDGNGESEDEQQGQNGQGQEGQTFTLGEGQGGEKVLLFSKGQGQGRSPGEGHGQPGGDKDGQGNGEQGKEPGHEHDPNVAGKATSSKMGTVDVQAQGLDTGKGASRSEVILGAAEKGFKGSAYKRVYSEYRTSAEEQLHQDKVPPGANEHIRRYFDLIRPRE
jgi:hypothetical protein